MRNTIIKYMSGAFSLVLTVFLTASVMTAQKTQDAKEMNKQKAEGLKEVREADKVFREIMSKPDKAIPRELLENATAVGIFPNVIKAAFIVGGRGGSGVVVRRKADGNWAMPVFYNVGGASFGAQIGGKSTDYIMLFMNEGALQDLLDDKLEFEGDVSFAAGPIGRTAGAGTNLTLDAGILTYSRSKGAFIGASLKGAVLTADNSINQAFYSENAGDVLKNPATVKLSPMPAEFKALTDTLTSYGGTSTKNPTKSASTMYPADKTAAENFQTRDVSYTDRGSRKKGEDPQNDFAQTRTPRGLARQIRNELLTLPYYSVFDWIEFEVDKDGVVTLNGEVISPPDTKSRAEAYVKDVEGVTKVINNIEVLPVSPNDDRLREQLYRAIYSGPLFRYQVGSLQSIHIIVKNGRATLKGIVDSEGDKNIAGIRAKGVSGVFEVTNDLIVSRAGMKP